MAVIKVSSVLYMLQVLLLMLINIPAAHELLTASLYANCINSYSMQYSN